MDSAAIEAVDKATREMRAAVLQAQQEWEEQCAYARRETVEARQALDDTREQLGQAQSALEITRREVAQARHERDNLSAELEQTRARLPQMDAALKNQQRYNEMLREKLLELYSNLRAKDLPTLILRLALGLVDAENALFTDATGSRTIASIGLDDLPENVRQALYQYTREAAQQDAPVVCNDAQTLPDGRNLINLAALPVAVSGNLTGIILVANRRSGDFGEEQTELLLAIGRHAGIAIENHRLQEELRCAYITTVAALADAIEAKDPYTRGHCEGVAEVAVEVAQKLGWDDDRIEKMRYAALLHDIGKIGVPDGILLKPGKLLPEEFQVIQKHSQIGSDLVGHIGWLKEAQPLILHHHERMDGSGYPAGLEGDAIPLGARIIGVVDALDAMITTRPYRNPVPVPEALAELERCAGQQFDAKIVQLVAEVLSERRKDEAGVSLTGEDDDGLEEHGTRFDEEEASKAVRAAPAG
jgi:HD-GYP domain-containing protein (c-di-GMP phosphodiesterase class II)